MTTNFDGYAITKQIKLHILQFQSYNTSPRAINRVTIGGKCTLKPRIKI